MHPAERLRAVIRWSGDDTALSVEAASALASFAELEGPAGVLVACRRILAHHPSCGPLWWTCARVVAAADAVAAAREAAALLDADRTAERLAAGLPIVDPDRLVAVVGWPDAADVALAARADIAAVAVRVSGADPYDSLRARVADRAVRVVGATELSDLAIDLLLVGASAFGGGRALVPSGSADVIDTVGSRPAVWLIGGVGRTLPSRLTDVVAAASEAADSMIESVSLERFDRVVGPRGLAHPHDAEARVDCPAPPELLRSM